MKLILFIVSLLSFSNVQVVAKENATWIKSTIFRGYDSTTKKKLEFKDIEALATKLKANNIHYAYIFGGPYSNDGHLPDYVFSDQAKDSIKALKKLYPEIKILPWIGGVQNKTVHLEKDEWVKNAIADTAKLVKTVPVDGVHLDLEYVLYPAPEFNSKGLESKNYGMHWVKFHRLLRLALPDAFISSVVVSTASRTEPWKHKHSMSEIKEVSSVIDQISFMFYETNIHDLKTYKDSLKEQLQQIKNLQNELGKETRQYLMGVGTFNVQKTLSSYRDQRFENLPLTLKLMKELDREISPKIPIVDGLAIFCEWETSDHEWNELRNSLK